MGGPSWRAAPSGGLPPRLESGSPYERGAPSAERPRMRRGPLRLPSCCRDPLQATWPVVCSCSVQARLSAPACGLGPTGELAWRPCALGLPASGGLTRTGRVSPCTFESSALTPRRADASEGGPHCSRTPRVATACLPGPVLGPQALPATSEDSRQGEVLQRALL